MKMSIQEAVRYLATRCDGAAQIDGMGFNKFDAGFGRSLAQQQHWTDRQMDAAIKMMKKYKNQLTEGGFNVEVIFDKEKQITLTGKKAIEKKPDKIVSAKEELLEIRFRYNEEIKEAIKAIPGRRFEPTGKYWTCPPSKEAFEILIQNSFKIDEKAIHLLSNSVSKKTKEEGKRKPIKTTTAAKKPVVNIQEIQEKLQVLQRTLYPYQQEGVAFVESRDGRALIADEMGLGKTLQAIAWLAIHPEKRPAIVLVPAHLKLNWEREINSSFKQPQNIQILNGKKISPITGDIIIINYDILTHWLESLQKIKAQVLVMDEAHYIKSNTAQRTKATKTLAKGIPHLIALTGTPIVNRPIEGFNIIQMIDKQVFPNRWSYAKRYCDAHHNGFGWDFTGASNQEELHTKLKGSVMIRRKKKTVLPELPDKQFSFFPIEIDNEREYRRAERDFIHYLREMKGKDAADKAKEAEHLVRIEALKQLAVAGKMKEVIQWVEDFIENGDKLVVFAIHKTVIDALMNKFGNIAVKIDGSVSSINRDKAVQEFQNNPEIKLFVGNIKAAGTGLTLTAASSVAFLEFDWVVGNHMQAEDRCHRIGQKDTVNIYYLIAAGTIEEKLVSLLAEKTRVIRTILDGEKAENINIFDELLESIGK